MTDVRAAPPAPTGYAPPAASAPEPCVTCGRPAGAPYCPHCGERRAADRHLTLRGMAEDAVEALSPADGRGLRSAWLLLRRPGWLTAEYVRGVRQPYLPPLRLFLLVNLAYFAFVGVTHQPVFTTRLGAHVYRSPYQATAARLVAARLAARRTTWDAYNRRFNSAAEVNARSLLGLTVPGFAVAVAAVHARRRRPALHHVAFAFHAVAALLVVLMVAGVAVHLPLEAVLRARGVDLDGEAADAALASPIFLLWGAWLVAAARAAYGDGRAAAAAKTVALLVGWFVMLGAYRAFLFFLTFWTT